MIKQVIALTIAASFGVAQAADVKPVAEVKPAIAPAAAVVKAEAQKAEVKMPEVKPVAAPEVQKEATKSLEKKVKTAKKAGNPVEAKVAPEAAKVEAVKAVEPVKK